MTNEDKAKGHLLPSGRYTWKQAALRIGENLMWSGPNGYYDFSPQEWALWALKQLEHYDSLKRENEELRKASKDILDQIIRSRKHDNCVQRAGDIFTGNLEKALKSLPQTERGQSGKEV